MVRRWFGDAAGQGAVPAKGLADDDTVASDLIFDHVDTMRASAHFHDHENLAQLAVD
jgi:hypothetical protein